ncbi:hypothetical protein MIN45_P2065 [Methylomarinovum tepidoasis]|uniref:Cation/H+ exchanger transmembrane domain-containing protein n=1 Tax=Methylomarinovum tepidoasis TaxID=2840183 RepID=A0AAU9CPU7_9GAMM|nr:cation:proton antiporter [Methylomarinovum sp. IN45]BCX89692.1 hypothetical protein MIN45_P2065 [Methylomarinovum sp. IN45]
MRKLTLLPLLAVPPAVSAAPRTLMELDPFAYILIELGLIIAAVVAGHLLARRLQLPVILGELLVGMVIGNFLYWSELSPLFFLIMHLGDASLLFREVWISGASVVDAAGRIFSPEELAPGGVGARLIDILVGDEGPGFLLMGSALWHFSNLGILFLWFRVALGMRIEELLGAGMRALAVAAAGVVAALGLGLVVLDWLLPEADFSTRLLLASGLAPTSASIALPLLEGFKAHHGSLVALATGAILVADVLAVLLVSTAVTLVQGGQGLAGAWGQVFGVVAYVGVVLYLCRLAPGWELLWLAEMEQYQALLLLPLGLAFLLAWIADMLSLSSLIGIFGAALLLNALDLEKRCGGKVSTRDLMQPLTQVFAPVFFVLLGMQINLIDFFSLQVLAMGVLLAAAAIGAKLTGAWLVARGTEGWLLGWSLVPRGEMALVVAATAKSLGVMSDDVYAAFMLMVIATMLAGSALLRRVAGETPQEPVVEYSSD